MIKRLGNKHYTKPPDVGNRKLNKESRTIQYGKHLSAATQYISMIGAGGVCGWLLDKLFNTFPYLLIVGIFLGAAAGLYHLIRSVNTIHKKTDD